MTKRRFSGALAATAAAVLVLSACTSGGEEPSEEPEGEGTSEETEAPEASGDACVTPLGITETAEGEIAYTAGGVEWTGYNGILSSTYSTYTSAINDRIQTGFSYYGADGTVCRNEAYGTFEAVSGIEDDGPLVVEYTISDDAVWSDGTPITADDYLLDWATNNPDFLDGSPFEAVSSSFADFVPEGPQVDGPGAKTFTIEYSEKYPDWQVVVTAPLPAHVAARESGLEPEALAQAILDRDAETVTSVAEFWNNWVSPTPGELPDPAISPSSGPYKLMEGGWIAGQSLTLEANPDYWGEPAATSHLVFRFLGEDGVVQALANRDLNVIAPQATVDTLNQLEQLGDDVNVETGALMTWEHLDFNFREDGQFETDEGEPIAGSVFADDAGGLALREAFAYCVPRQDIVNNLIAPIQEDAVVMNAREVFPFQDHYDEVVSAAYDGRFDVVDLDAASEKFAEANVGDSVDVRIGYAAPNPRRSDQVAAIKASCDQVGFNIIDAGDANFFDRVMPNGDYEVALFAWAGSGQIASGRNIYATEMPQNYGMFSNEEVDAAWNTLASSLDPAVQLEQVKVIEGLLWDNLFGIPVFAHPGIQANTSDVTGVRFNSTQTGAVWNAEQWAIAQ